MRAWGLLAGLCTACYHPASEAGDCAISCATAPCPGDLVCGAHQLCRAASSSECPAATGADAAFDAAADGPPGTTCYGDGLMRICVPPQTTSLTYPADATIDTTSCGMVIGTTRGTACVIAAKTITISATVIVTGPEPLLLLGTDALTVASGGSLDASSHSASGGDTYGAGAPTLCGWTTGNGNGNTTATATGSSGGAGGSFGGAGGTGGTSNGYLGGTAGPISSPTVQSGCSGSAGGVSGAIAGPQGGAGGGAVYLMTGGTLSISGTINASGAGGHRAATGNGGAGGGSGGFIGLDAKSYSIATAGIYAIGGGGSCGGTTLGPGSAGYEATGPSATATCIDTDNGGNGGAGGVAGGAPGGSGGNASTAYGGGGGGGGGGGIIAVANLAQFPKSMTTIQPPPVAMP